MRKRLLTILLSLLVLMMAALSVLVPFLYLRVRNNRKDGLVEDIPASYYSRRSSSYAKNASRQLTGAEQLRLIYGLWESETTALVSSSEELQLTPYEAADAAKKYLKFLAGKNAWPMKLINSMDSWYTWTARPYRATDAAFRSFSVLYWLITFTRYDSTETHTVCLTDSGNFCFAYTGDTELERLPEEVSDTYTVSTNAGSDIQSFQDTSFLQLIPSTPYETGFTAESTWLYEGSRTIPTIPHYRELLEQDAWAGDVDTAYLYMEKSPTPVSAQGNLTLDSMEQLFNSPSADSFCLMVRNAEKPDGTGAVVILLPYQN